MNMLGIKEVINLVRTTMISAFLTRMVVMKLVTC